MLQFGGDTDVCFQYDAQINTWFSIKLKQIYEYTVRIHLIIQPASEYVYI